MKQKALGILLLILAFCSFKQLKAQELNYNQINVQGQLFSAGYDVADFEFIVLDIVGDTLWRESHSGISLTTEGSFTLPFGAGTYISGTAANFYEIDWTTAARMELYHLGDSRYLQGSFFIKAVPYALHSLNVLNRPDLVGLSDVEDAEEEEGHIFIYDGANYLFGFDELDDTTLFALYTEDVLFSDTANFGFNSAYADTAGYSYYTDTANVVINMNSSIYADSVTYADSAGYVFSSPGNWSIFGDEGLSEDHFIGPTTEELLGLRTNSNPRLIFEDDFSTHMNFPGVGFRLNPTSGILFTPNTNPGVGEVDSSYLYFDGASASFHGGINEDPIDTLMGPYSFAWGENVGTNGPYSTVFGKDTYGDTALFGGMMTPFAAVSSFAMGKNCRVAHMGFAFGDSAIANYYRNIAIGKNVTANTASSGLAMGNNIEVTGATSWAAGKNLTVDAHFSTAMGTNARSDGNNGSFVYGDNSTTDTVKNTAADQFMVRAAGGYVFYSTHDLTMGVELLPGGGSWSMVSDRNKKRNINLLSPTAFHAAYDSLTVSSWNYIGNSTLHIGPMAQDFYSAFGVGEKPYYINMIDSDGATFLGIKMLHEELKDTPSAEEVEKIENEIDKEKKELEKIEERINQLYEELDHN